MRVGGKGQGIKEVVRKDIRGDKGQRMGKGQGKREEGRRRGGNRGREGRGTKGGGKG